MRACAAIQGCVTSVVLAAAAFAACSSSPAPQPPPTDAPSGTMAAADPGATTADPGSASAPAQAQAKKKAPETVNDCKELLTEITNEPPDGGVVMNNAQTAADAGASDRFAPMVELMKQKRDAFRCCFDIWAKKNPGAQGRVAFVFELNPKGELRKAYIKNDESDVRHPDVESCMVEVAKSMTYPKSPSGKDTEYTHRFDFKARH